MSDQTRAMTDAADRVTGRIPLVLDQTLPDLVHAKVVRSMVPHGTITELDIEDALAAPGVLAVVTGRDVIAMGAEPVFGGMRKDQPIVAWDRVRYVGEPVAIVVAEQRRQAVDAAELVFVDYDELPNVTDAVEATSPDAPQLHEDHPGNDCGDWRLHLGDVDAAIAAAPHVYTNTYRTPTGSHVPMEPHVAVARWDGEDRLEVWTSAQSPWMVRTGLQGIFGIEDVSVRVPNIGGGYGAKGQVKIEPMAAVAARAVGRPVKLVLDRDEVFATIGRHAGTVVMTTAVDDDGTILARDVDVVYNAGAYAVTSPFASGQGLVRAPGPYRIPNVRARSRAVYTNTVPTGPFRGAMTGQVALAYELQLDEIAADLGIDRLEIRRRNVLHDGDQYATHEHMHDMHYDDLIDRTAEAIGWGRVEQPADPTRRRGKGLGITLKSTLTPSRSEARLVVTADGRIVVHSATTEMGQGGAPTVALLTAEALGVDPDVVERAPIDTDDTPFDTTTASSRSTFSMGVAIRDAADQMRLALEALVDGEVVEHRDAGLVTADGVWRSYADVVAGAGHRELETTGVFQSEGGLRGKDPDDVRGSSTVHWHQGAAAVEVEVDVETGHVRIVDAVGAAYAGRVLSPTRVAQQNVGCVVMGLGPTLFEELVYDDGQPTNPNLSDYMIPSILDVPPTIGSVAVESGDDDAELHGVGEMAIPPIPPAVASAIHDAVGVWIRDVPITPERVLRALEEKDTARGSRVATSEGIPA